jgi:hypothetical protein
MDSTGARTNIDGQFWGDSEIDPENEWLFFSRTDPEFRFQRPAPVRPETQSKTTPCWAARTG